MINYRYIGSGGVKTGGEALCKLVVPTCHYVYEDLKFFFNKSKESDIDPTSRERYARCALVFLAFYFESLANLLVYNVGKEFNCSKQLKVLYKKRDHYPESLRKFMAVYHVLYGQTLPLSVHGIQDLFLIRNQVIAHPRAMSIICGTKVPKEKGLTEEEKPLPFSKFSHFPNIYEKFIHVHVQQLYDETKDFLERYHNLVRDKLPEAVLRHLKKL